MLITVLDFVLINIISYVAGTATGIILCVKYKNNLFVRSRSLDNLSRNVESQSQTISNIAAPVIASAPANPVTKITLE